MPACWYKPWISDSAIHTREAHAGFRCGLHWRMLQAKASFSSPCDRGLLEAPSTLWLRGVGKKASLSQGWDRSQRQQPLSSWSMHHCEAQSHSTRRDEIVSLWLPGGISRYLAARLLSSPSSDPALLRRSKHATRSSQMGADPEGTMRAGWCVFDDYTKDRQCDFMDLVSPKPISCIECALVHSHLLASGT